MSNVSERLTSSLMDDGEWHAHYPTAERTLCSRPVPEKKIGRRYPPTCEACVACARLFNAIDSSAPTFWRLRKTAKDVEAVARLDELAA